MPIFSIEGRLAIFKGRSNISTNKYDISILPDFCELKRGETNQSKHTILTVKGTKHFISILYLSLLGRVLGGPCRS